MKRLIIPAVVVLLVGAGCSNAAEPEPANSTTSAPTSSAAQSQTPSAANQDASALYEALAAQIPQLSLVTVYDADTDPNDLLGRPGGYTSKVAFADAGVPPAEVASEDPDAIARGGSIEVFPQPAQAQSRMDYIQALMQDAGIAAIAGTEYNYVQGGALLRVSGKLHPDLAAAYEQAFATATGNPAGVPQAE